MSRSFNANFVTEKNKISDGPGPYNIIEFGFATPLEIMDRKIDTPRYGSVSSIALMPGSPTSSTGVAVYNLTGEVWALGGSNIYRYDPDQDSVGFVLFDTVANVAGICVDQITGDVYCVNLTNVYKYTYGDDSAGFVSLFALSGIFPDICIDYINGFLYSPRSGIGLYRHVLGVGGFSIYAEDSGEDWACVNCNSQTGKIYLGAHSGEVQVYDPDHTSLGFVDLGAPSNDWRGLGINEDNNDVFITDYASGGDVYLYIEDQESAGWVAQGINTGQGEGVAINSLTYDIFMADFVDGIYTIIKTIKQFPTLVKSWSFLDSNLGYVSGGSIIDIPAVPEFQITLINSEDPRFTDNITADDPIEGIEVILYQAFEGLDQNDKEILFKGVVRGKVVYNETECTLNIKGIWEKYNRTIGETLLVSEDDYPSCDPDDVGKMQNIIYGSVSHAPCLALDAGGVDNLASTITDSQTTLPLVDTTKLRTAGNGKLGIEPISWTGKTGNTLTGITRGAGAAASPAGTVVFEVLTTYVYQLASHPVKNVNDVYVDNFLVNNVATKYTGKTGDELSGYEGTAVVSLPALVSRANSITLLEANGMTNSDATAAVASVAGSASLTISDIIALFRALSTDEGSHDHTGNEVIVVWKFDFVSANNGFSFTNFGIDSDFSTATSGGSAGNYVRYGKGFFQDYPGPPTFNRACLALRADHSGATMRLRAVSNLLAGVFNAAAGTTAKSSWTANGSGVDTWAEMNNQLAELSLNAGSGANDWTAQIWYEVKYQASAGASPATNVLANWSAGVTKGVDKSTIGVKGGNVTRTGVTNLSGNSVATVEVGVLVSIDCDGTIDDDSAETLLELPNDIIQHILINYCSFPSDDIGSSFATSGSFYSESAQGYTFAFIINKRIEAEQLLSRLSIQCRSRFYVTTYGTAELVVRKLAQSATHSIPKSEIKYNSMEIFRSSEDDIVNTFNIRFDRDWRLGGSDFYRKTSPFSDATSITRYDVREPSDSQLFDFFAVKDTLMMFDVGTYWLTLLKVSRVIPSFGVFLDNLEIEAGDYLGITHPLDNMADFVVEVLSTRHVLGSATRKVLDRIELSTLEN